MDGLALFFRAQLEQKGHIPFEHEFGPLVPQFRGQRNAARGALRFHGRNLQLRVERIAAKDGLHEAGRLAYKGHEGIFNQIGEVRRPRRGVKQHLQGMNEDAGEAPLLGELHIVMKGMIIAAGGPEGRHFRVTNGARGDVKGFPQGKILKVAGLRKLSLEQGAPLFWPASAGCALA